MRLGERVGSNYVQGRASRACYEKWRVGLPLGHGGGIQGRNCRFVLFPTRPVKFGGKHFVCLFVCLIIDVIAGTLTRRLLYSSVTRSLADLPAKVTWVNRALLQGALGSNTCSLRCLVGPCPLPPFQQHRTEPPVSASLPVSLLLHSELLHGPGCIPVLRSAEQQP